ncbi:condensation domain-containing protein [Vallitalea okinawensis]|uniref:alcohol acetyltransferase n=1 Tax=Vallitalea okinawensis TaxID=2078660 RepID=UPI000CFBE837|nr:alcohol acetyltransferase [Vallitalea okinawensis]
MPKWFRLDNAAKIYPAFATKEDTATFRLAAILYDNINPEQLQKALESIMGRFPSMAVSMRKGLFWYYFEPNPNKPLVHLESASPCRAIDKEENNGYLFKVFYYKKRIAVECFHALTDGYGGIEFLKALVFAYIKYEYPDMEPDKMIKVAGEQINREELEDSFKAYYESDIQVKPRPRDVGAQHIVGTPMRENTIIVSHGRMSASQLNQIAKKRGATITVYLTAILIMTINNMNKQRMKVQRPIVVAVPVNLRRIFPSETMRNFSYFVNVVVKPSDNLTLDQIIQQIKKQMKEGLKKETLYTHIHHNVSFEKNIVLRLTPNFIKNLLLKQVRTYKSKKVVTTTLTNPGIIHMPEVMKAYVEHFECVLYASKPHYINTAVCSYNDHLVVSISRAMQEHNLVDYYFDYLTKESGLTVELYSNGRSENK